MRMFLAMRYVLFLAILAWSLPASADTVNPLVRFDMFFGTIDVELYPDAAPNTVANFLNYVEDTDGEGNPRRRYEETLFHRYIPGFVLQGGGYRYDDNGQIVPIEVDGTVDNEFSISNTVGTIAMAKLGGDPDSATSQWFFNLNDNSGNLDNQNEGFTVFGEIVNGLEVLGNIEWYYYYGDEQGRVGTDNSDSPYWEENGEYFNISCSISQLPGFYGDANGSGSADGDDLLTLQQQWNPAGSDLGWSDGDFDGDRDIDAEDLALLGLHWNPPAAATVPEPASLAALLGGMGLLLRRRRKVS